MGADGLLRYGAMDALLAHADDNIDNAEAWLRAQALLPPGRDGDALAHEAHEIASSLIALRSRTVEAAQASVVSGNVVGIFFRFDDVHADARAIVTAGRLDGKRWLRVKIDHLLLASALGERARTNFIFYEKINAEPVEFVLHGISREKAEARLHQLLSLWREGQDKPLPFAAKAAHVYASTLRRKNDEIAAWNAALNEYAPFGRKGESEDPWLRLAFRPEGLLGRFDSAQAQRFREIALLVFDAREPGA